MKNHNETVTTNKDLTCVLCDCNCACVYLQFPTVSGRLNIISCLSFKELLGFAFASFFKILPCAAECVVGFFFFFSLWFCRSEHILFEKLTRTLIGLWRLQKPYWLTLINIIRFILRVVTVANQYCLKFWITSWSASLSKVFYFFWKLFHPLIW